MYTPQQLQQFENSILNMDCIDFLKKCPNDYFDLVLTDPPYNINIDTWDKINNYEQFIKDIYYELKRLSKSIVLFFDYSYTRLFENLDEVTERFIWHREGGYSGNFIKKSYEPFYLYGDNVKKYTQSL